MPVEELGAIVARAIVERCDLDSARIDDVLFGQCYTNGEVPCTGRWVAMQAVPILFIVADRYRLATWPFVVLCAAVGVGALLELRERWPAGERPGKAWCSRYR